jgi:cytidine deaminase
MDEADSELMIRARGVRSHAYAPYSHFRVGAALESDDGRVFEGCNVENASLGLTICAERAAVAAAVAHGAKEFARLALSSDGPEPVAPCGACRQVLMEFAPFLRIRSEAGGQATEWTLPELLPAPFGLEASGGDSA